MKNTIKVINELKKKKLIKDYAIGGAIGVLRWVEPFFTRDLDVFIIPAPESKDRNIIQFSSIYDYLKEKGYNKWIGQWIVIEGIPVEFIPAEGLGEEAVENAKEIEFEGIKTKIMIPEYLIALLITAGRDKDIIKVRMLLDQAEVDAERLKIILNKYDLNEKYRCFTKKDKNA